MSMSIRVRLSLMMLLQYAIWGAWAPVLSGYLGKPVSEGGLGFQPDQLGWIYSMLPLASIITPFFAGQIADRYLATERFLGILHLLGSGALLLMASQQQYMPMLIWMLVFSLFYAPTLALTNSLAFSHMSNSEKEFGGIRVWGTIGWIVSGLLLTLFRNQFPALTPKGMSDSLLLAGILAFVLGVLSFGLPHTPPKREGVNPWAFLDALKLMKDRNFLVFIVVSFVVATELQFYYVLTAPFLEKGMGVPGENVPAWMTLGQIAEIVVMAALLPALLPKMGLRKTMVVGIIAWPVRYVIFALGADIPSLTWLVIASLTLHGFCYVFFFTVGFIYVDRVASADIRASAQNLIALVVLGVGSYVGSLFTDTAGVTNWRNVFLVPVVLTVLCAIVFPLLFREKAEQDTPAIATSH